MVARPIGEANARRHRGGDVAVLGGQVDTFDPAIPGRREKTRRAANAAADGRAAIYDPIGGSREPLDLPVPWARDASMSFLIDSDATRAKLEAVGLRIEAWHDVSKESAAWFLRNAAGAKEHGPQPLGLHLLLGPEWPTIAANMASNIAAGRIAAVQILARKV